MASEAEKLLHILEAVWDVRFERHEFVSTFNRALRRSLARDAEDFVALVLAEAWEDAGAAPLSWEQFKLVLGRVQSRLHRAARRHARRPAAQQFEDATVDLTLDGPDVADLAAGRESTRAVSAAMSDFLNTLKPDEAILFDLCIANEWSVDRFLEVFTSVSRATAYRQIKDLRRRFERVVKHWLA